MAIEKIDDSVVHCVWHSKNGLLQRATFAPELLEDQSVLADEWERLRGAANGGGGEDKPETPEEICSRLVEQHMKKIEALLAEDQVDAVRLAMRAAADDAIIDGIECGGDGEVKWVQSLARRVRNQIIDPAILRTAFGNVDRAVVAGVLESCAKAMADPGVLSVVEGPARNRT